MELLLIALVAGSIAGVIVLALNSVPRDVAVLRAQAEGQLRRTKIDDPARGIDFDGSIATVVETRESKYLAALVKSNYVLTVVAAMPDGVAYVFRSSTDGKPWVVRKAPGNSRAVQATVPF